MKKEKILKSRKNSFIFKMIWLVLLVLISALLASYVIRGTNDMLAVGREQKNVKIEVPENAGIVKIAGILKENGVIYDPGFFIMYAATTRSTKGITPGTYELDTSMDYQTILNSMRNRGLKRETAEITVTEGMNLLEIAEFIQEKGICAKSDFLNACSSNEFDKKFEFIGSIENVKSRKYKLEGYLFPDTYEFYKNETAGNTVSKFLKNFQVKCVKRNAIKGYENKTSIVELAIDKNMLLDKVIILASLIQAEAADKDDMYKVSSVIQNRLKTLETGGKNSFNEYNLDVLRIDATSFYPYKSKNLAPQNFESNYDTYKIKGLPPGPICNPGMDAIHAALHPASTDFYYYCHSKDGKAFYAKTNDAHIANLKKAGLSN